MPSVSLITITKNEERNIGRLLASVKGFADEMIVVDSDSTDKTRDIAESMGAKVLQLPWEGYGPTRNRGAEHATGDYFLFLDADEALSDELRDWLIERKEKLTGAYEFNRFTNYCGTWIKHSGWYPDKKLRMYQKGDAEWEDRVVHEGVSLKSNVKVTRPPHNLLHYSYYVYEEHKLRTEKYARLAAQELQKKSGFTLSFKKWFSPAFKLLQVFVLKLGFLDGSAGWRIARMTAREAFLKHRDALRLKAAGNAA